jgi:magnesium transporter
VAIRKDISIDRAIQVIRELASEVETIYYIYVVDELNHLAGVISLRELIVSKSEVLVEEIMHTNVISVKVNLDQEEVARIVAKYDFLAVPVVDEDNELLGIVTVDDVIDVIQEEATEDLYRLAGTSEIDDEVMLKGVFFSVRSRLPWLLVTLAGGVVSGSVIKAHEDILTAVLSLVTFLPVVSGMGGNVGTQSSTITVRGIATGMINSRNVIRTIFKEATVGLAMGLICGIILAFVAYYWRHTPVLGLVVGVALWGNMLVAATIGTLAPLVFKKVGVDPAIASAPFISTTIDITGYLISFTLTRLLLSFLT